MTGLLLALVATVGANAFDETFEKANAAYADGRFAEAVLGYEQLTGSSVENPVVFFNLGNAYFRLGDLGRAIANYERAQRLEPRHEGARANLMRAQSATQRALNAPLGSWLEQSLLFWDRRWSPEEVRWTAIGLWLTFWALLIAGLYKTFRYRRAITVLTLILAVLFGYSAWTKANPDLVAIAARDEVAVRLGPSDDDEQHFVLYEGDSVAVEEVKAGWVKVRTIDGARGWAPFESIYWVGPPYSVSAEGDA